MSVLMLHYPYILEKRLKTILALAFWQLLIGCHFLAFAEGKGNAALKYEFNLDTELSGQYIGAGTSTESDTIPLTLRYNDIQPILRLDGYLKIGDYLTVVEDVHFTIQEGLFFSRNTFYNVADDFSTMNSHIMYRSAVYFTKGNLMLQIGRDKIKFGPGQRGNVALSDNIPFFDALLLQYKMKAIYFYYMLSKINIEKDPKYFIYHRLEIPFGKHFIFSIAESDLVLVDQAGFEHFNPVFIYHNVEIKYDNVITALDFIYSHAWGSIYGELAGDDVLFKEFEKSSRSPTALAYLLGFSLEKIPFLVNSKLAFEYVHVDEYMYERYLNNTNSDLLTYRVKRDFPKVPQMLGDPEVIGHWTGPHADDIYLGITYKPIQKTTFRLSYENIVKGVEPNNTQKDRDISETRNIISIAGEFQMYEKFQFSGRYSFSTLENFDHIQDRDLHTHELESVFSVRF